MRQIFLNVFLCLCILLLFDTAPLFAADAANGFMTYHEPQPAGVSILSTIAYLLSLVVTFVVVIGLAYLASRFLGLKMGRLSSNTNNKVLLNLPLGPNRAVCAVEITDKVLILGVTDHSINLLEEITSPAAIQALKSEQLSRQPNQFDDVLQRHLASLQQLPQKFPGVFNVAQTPSEHEKR